MLRTDNRTNLRFAEQCYQFFKPIYAKSIFKKLWISRAFLFLLTKMHIKSIWLVSKVWSILRCVPLAQDIATWNEGTLRNPHLQSESLPPNLPTAFIYMKALIICTEQPKSCFCKVLASWNHKVFAEIMFS